MVICSASFVLENKRLVPHDPLGKDTDQDDSHKDQTYFEHNKVHVHRSREQISYYTKIQ
jgi:hypothetical protein